jgi:uncharacterized protein YhfF
VLETTDLRVIPFGEVDAQFAFDEGEGDRTLAWWRSVASDVTARAPCSVHVVRLSKREGPP